MVTVTNKSSQSNAECVKELRIIPARGFVAGQLPLPPRANLRSTHWHSSPRPPRAPVHSLEFVFTQLNLGEHESGVPTLELIYCERTPLHVISQRLFETIDAESLRVRGTRIRRDRGW